jgi:hypothetical protein
MRKLRFLLPMLFACAGGMLCAQTVPQGGDKPDVPLIDRAHAQDWSRDIDTGWRMHEGDDPAWASPGFDDSAWQTVQLDALGLSRPGWRWFRLHLKLNENHPDLSLLIDGGEGTYSLYVNGVVVEGPAVRSSLGVGRSKERAIALDAPGSDLVLALRTHASPGYANWHGPLSMSASLGTTNAIDAQRDALERVRFYPLIPAVAINLLLMVAGIGAFSLHLSQPGHPEYRWLALYLFLIGTADLLWYSCHAVVVPLAANFLIADPLLYAVAIAQIEFTFSFGRMRVGRFWRMYEFFLLAPLPLIWLTWQGLFPSDWFIVVEGLILVPVAVLLPLMLLFWYRRGNREAGWLILPSLLPAASISLYDFGTLAVFLGWKRFEFFDNSIPIGPFAIQVNDLCNLLFLFAMVVVMFFRFSSVSREQARSAAEFGAAREIQQRLVPASLPQLKGYHIETAYLPAQEVGGDFYQILEQADGYTLIVVGDVSGKGLKAAMTGALAIGALRTLAAENHSPGTLLARLNRQMHSTQESGFITCLCLRLSAVGAMTFANAGHLSPYRGGQEIEIDSGLPLGLSATSDYVETALQLEPGETLTLLSDGVVEAMNADHQLFGFERTRALSTQSAEAIATAAQAFGQEDDITVLTIARSAVPA